MQTQEAFRRVKKKLNLRWAIFPFTTKLAHELNYFVGVLSCSLVHEFDTEFVRLCIPYNSIYLVNKRTGKPPLRT